MEGAESEPPQLYYGVPHKKLLAVDDERPSRGRFPHIGTGKEVEQRLCEILKDAKDQKLPRLWAVGYNDVWTRSNDEPDTLPPDSKGKGRATSHVETQSVFSSDDDDNNEVEDCGNGKSYDK